MAQRHTPLQLAVDLGAAVLDTSITLWWRWPIFLAAGMASRDSAELKRMVSEKVAAATSGTVAAQTETMQIAARAVGKENTACGHGGRGGGVEARTSHCEGERQAAGQEPPVT